ncbi:MAG: GtrA family protein [Candidatus Saganbacteria bacterium]|nr:GtrA family protein [Candidatus Saganbacteria bacterium]
MKRFYTKHRDKIWYLLVGLWNTLFGYLVFVALYFLLAKKINYMILVVISNILAITNAYIGYKIFVFRTRGNYLKEYLRFYVIYGGAIALNLILLPVLVEFFAVTPIVGQGIVMIVIVVGTYFGHKHFSFRVSKRNLNI